MTLDYNNVSGFFLFGQDIKHLVMSMESLTANESLIAHSSKHDNLSLQDVYTMHTNLLLTMSKKYGSYLEVYMVPLIFNM